MLTPSELLVEIVIPKRRMTGQRVAFFEKVGQRRAQTIAKASVALNGWLDHGRWGNVRIAMGAVSPTVVGAPRATDVLVSRPFDDVSLIQVAELAAQECDPIDDIRSTASYRRRLVRGLLIRNLLSYATGE